MRVLVGARVAVALLAASCSAAPGPVVADGRQAAEARIYVIERGWHSDVGFPADEIAGPLSVLKQSLPGLRFLTFGFGERRFLMARHATLSGTAAALLPSRSALLMTTLGATPEAAFGRENVVALRITRAGLARVEARLWGEFEKGAAGAPVRLAGGPYPGSVFYASRSTYDAFFTCNTWTAAMLRSAGLPMPTAGVVFVGQVMGRARRIGRQQGSGSHG